MVMRREWVQILDVKCPECNSSGIFSYTTPRDGYYGDDIVACEECSKKGKMIKTEDGFDIEWGYVFLTEFCEYTKGLVNNTNILATDYINYIKYSLERYIDIQIYNDELYSCKINLNVKNNRIIIDLSYKQNYIST